MRRMSDETVLLREAIKEVLDNATEPLTSTQIHEAPPVYSLGLGPIKVSQELKVMHERRHKPFPLSRIPSSQPGKAAWEYFNPEVVRLSASPRRPAEPPEPKTWTAAPEFKFNPLDFQPGQIEEQQEVHVPQGVKAITLTIGGVNIKIELS